MSTTATGPVQSTKPVEWQIDPAHSAAHFSVRHMMISNVRGEFSKLSGHAVIDPTDLTKSTVEVSLETTSISTREPQRDEHSAQRGLPRCRKPPDDDFSVEKDHARRLEPLQTDGRSHAARRHEGSLIRRGASYARRQGSMGQCEDWHHGNGENQPERFWPGLERAG